MNWDESTVSRWLEPLASRPGELAEVFGETLREMSLDWHDGEIRGVRVRQEQGTGARWRHGGQEQFVFVPGSDESAVREAVRSLRSAAGRNTLPIRPSRNPTEEEGDEARSELLRWSKRLTGIFARQAPRHRFEFRIRETKRRVVSPGRPSSACARRLVSIEGRFTAASRPADEERLFSFHAPDADATGDELRSRLTAAATPRDRAVPVAEGETDVVLAEGCAAILFHEIIGHPMEADAGDSPLAKLGEARVAVSELEVHDDPTRLDLFGGYERDDEGTLPRSVKLVHAGHVGSRLTDRGHAGTTGLTGHGRRAGASDAPLPRSSNILIHGGGATPEELARRLGNGIWIEEFRAGSVALTSGSFRLRFSRARRVRRGRLADELGPGILAGELLPALKNIEPVLGRQVHPCRSFGWCSRGGQVVPVQGAAPDVLIRRLAVRPTL